MTCNPFYCHSQHPHLTQHDLTQEVVGPVALHLDNSEHASLPADSAEPEVIEVVDTEFEHSTEGELAAQSLEVAENQVSAPEPLVRIVPTNGASTAVSGQILRIPANQQLGEGLALLSTPSVEQLESSRPTVAAPRGSILRDPSQNITSVTRSQPKIVRFVS